MRRIIGTALLVACAALASGCGESPEDQARKAGEQVGKQLHQLQTADSAEAAGKAIDDLDESISTAKEDLPSAMGDQLTAIKDQLTESVSKATDGSARRAAYLSAAAQFNALASDTNSVFNEFRRGVREGLNGE